MNNVGNRTTAASDEPSPKGSTAAPALPGRYGRPLERVERSVAEVGHAHLMFSRVLIT
jgi:hypothetical protein